MDKKISSGYSTPFINNNKLYITAYYDKQENIYCVDTNNGKIKWGKPIDFGSFILDGNRFIYITEKGRIIVIDANANKYTEISKTKLKSGLYWASPVLYNGNLYCRNSSTGEIYCINLK